MGGDHDGCAYPKYTRRGPDEGSNPADRSRLLLAEDLVCTRQRLVARLTEKGPALRVPTRSVPPVKGITEGFVLRIVHLEADCRYGEQEIGLEYVIHSMPGR